MRVGIHRFHVPCAPVSPSLFAHLSEILQLARLHFELGGVHRDKTFIRTERFHTSAPCLLNASASGWQTGRQACETGNQHPAAPRQFLASGLAAATPIAAVPVPVFPPIPRLSTARGALRALVALCRTAFAEGIVWKALDELLRLLELTPQDLVPLLETLHLPQQRFFPLAHRSRSLCMPRTATAVVRLAVVRAEVVDRIRRRL